MPFLRGASRFGLAIWSRRLSIVPRASKLAPWHLAARAWLGKREAAGVDAR